ncbi:MAG: insulinase family protein [Acidobacteriota bacterium]|nr:insulinase family protein [Acidobacteriota bacterium]
MQAFLRLRAAWPRRLPALALAAGLAVVVAPALRAMERPPKLAYQIATLPNGLTVVLSEDHSTPIVNLQVWYHVGSKDEKPGRTGFAHLFEHLMFGGSQNVAPDQHTSIISSIGGRSNAYTTQDTTVFWETVPSQYLPLALWLEADRMATLRIDKATFEKERAVVKEERRMRVDNQPYGSLSELIYEHAFTASPYRHPVIGSMADLDTASVDDVRDFYHTYYVPKNATLVLVGDFDPAQAMQEISEYLGRVPPSNRPIPRDYAVDPPQTQEQRVTLHEAWPLPVVAVAYHITYDGDPDSYPLHIISKVLSDGDSSRIYQDLVYKKGIALAAFGGGDIMEEPSLFYAVAIVQPGHTTDEVTAALLDEFDRLKADGITAHELDRAKNQFARDYIIGRETDQQKASQLAHAVVIHHDVTTADGEFDIFMHVTQADVQRVAQKYFTKQNRTVITILPSAAPRATPGLAGAAVHAQPR